MSADIFRVGVKVRVKTTKAIGIVIDLKWRDGMIHVLFDDGEAKRETKWFRMRDLERLHWLEGGTFFGDER